MQIVCFGDNLCKISKSVLESPEKYHQFDFVENAQRVLKVIC